LQLEEEFLTRRRYGPPIAGFVTHTASSVATIPAGSSLAGILLNACTGRHRLSTINREGRWHPAFRSRLPRRTSPELPAQGPPRRCTEQTPATTEPRAALALMLFRHDGGIRAALARRINRRHTGAWLAKSSGRNAGELIILRCGRGARWCVLNLSPPRATYLRRGRLRRRTCLIGAIPWWTGPKRMKRLM
jgi:hypothetical protein